MASVVFFVPLVIVTYRAPLVGLSALTTKTKTYNFGICCAFGQKILVMNRAQRCEYHKLACFNGWEG